MRISEFLSPQAVVADLSGTSKQEVLEELCRLLSAGYPGLKADKLLETLQEREKLGSTGIGDGVAIPHGKLAGLPKLIAAFAMSRKGVDFSALDGGPSYLFFALLAPENSAGVHLKALARISRVFKNAAFRDQIRKAGNAQQIYDAIVQEDARV